MTQEQLLVLAILIGSLIIFITDRLRVDLVALLVLIALALSGLVTPEEAFAGLANPAVITVIAVFIISAALVKTGVADFIARHMLRVSGDNPRRIIVVIMLTTGLMSAIMNNIGAAAILLPAVLMIAKQTDISPSKLLIPLAFSSLLGGNMTAIGTPPNILANGILARYPGLEPFNFFDFTPTGTLVLLAGVVYMGLLGFLLLPDRAKSGGLQEDYVVSEHLSTVVIEDTSALVGKTIADSGLLNNHELRILSVQRLSGDTFIPRAASVLRAQDRLIVQGDHDALERLNHPEEQDDDELEAAPEAAHSAETLNVGELIIAPGSELAGQSLRESDFINQYDLVVMAVGQRKETRSHDFGEVKLRVGDTLMVTGSAEKLDSATHNENFIQTNASEHNITSKSNAIVAVAILIAVLITASLNIQPIAIAMLTGAIALVLLRILSMEEAYDAVDWKAVFLIAGMLPLGTAMQNTGTAALIAERIITALGNLGPHAVMLGVYLLTVAITSVISNAAATVLIVPIAIDAALGINVSPYPFVMATVIAASTSFLLPIGHQVNVLVYGPGHYRFSDFARAGAGLTLLIMLLVGLLLPLVWPF